MTVTIDMKILFVFCSEDAEDLVVVLNEHDFNNKTETMGVTVRRNIEEIIMFPYYLETTFYGDIALIKFTHPVDITSSTLTPVCLPDSDDGMDDGKEVIAAGFHISFYLSERVIKLS